MVMASVTGTISRTVVTLSRKAESTAVVTCSKNRMPAGCAFAALADQMAMYWNMPERREIDTRIIMPASSPIVFQSMPRIASSWLITPSTTMIAAPTRVTTERLICSEMITA